METLERYGVSPEIGWLGALVAGVVALVGGALAFPRSVYDGFIWQYFWGPVHADAASASCAVRTPGAGTELLYDSSACAQRVAEGAIVGEPGYTVVSTVGYMVVLVFMLVGVYFLLSRLDLKPYSEFLFALVPFMLFGGALRVVEDATDAAVDTVLAEYGPEVAAKVAQGASLDDAVQGSGIVEGVTGPAIAYPLNTVLISPVIYGTVFAFALVALLAAKWLQHRGYTETYHYPLGAIGVGALVLTLAHLTNLALTRDYVDLHLAVLLTVVVLASLIALGVYRLVDRWWPVVNAGTGLVGLVVIWAHAIDGVANVVASDWTRLFGIDITYGSKHVFNRFIISVTETVQPAWLTAAVGDSWPFLVVKVLVATAILALFDEQFMEESPRYSIMLLGAIVAVGLGPGTRDVLRVTFGI